MLQIRVCDLHYRLLNSGVPSHSAAGTNSSAVHHRLTPGSRLVGGASSFPRLPSEPVVLGGSVLGESLSHHSSPGFPTAADYQGLYVVLRVDKIAYRTETLQPTSLQQDHSTHTQSGVPKDSVELSDAAAPNSSHNTYRRSSSGHASPTSSGSAAPGKYRPWWNEVFVVHLPSLNAAQDETGEFGRHGAGVLSSSRYAGVVEALELEVELWRSRRLTEEWIGGCVFALATELRPSATAPGASEVLDKVFPLQHSTAFQIGVRLRLQSTGLPLVLPPRLRSPGNASISLHRLPSSGVLSYTSHPNAATPASTPDPHTRHALNSTGTSSNTGPHHSEGSAEAVYTGVPSVSLEGSHTHSSAPTSSSPGAKECSGSPGYYSYGSNYS